MEKHLFRLFGRKKGGDDPCRGIDLESHKLQISEEGDKLRVLAGGRSYLFATNQREEFLKLYCEAWGKVELDPSSFSVDGDEVGLTDAVFFSLRQRIALNWVYVLLVGHRHTRSLFWRLGTPTIRGDVLKAAESMFGTRSEKAIAVAAHTLKMDIETFKKRLKGDQEFYDNM